MVGQKSIPEMNVLEWSPESIMSLLHKTWLAEGEKKKKNEKKKRWMKFSGMTLTKEFFSCWVANKLRNCSEEGYFQPSAALFFYCCFFSCVSSSDLLFWPLNVFFLYGLRFCQCFLYGRRSHVVYCCNYNHHFFLYLQGFIQFCRLVIQKK